MAEILHPLVFWAQSDDKVTLRVELREVSSPHIDIQGTKLVFKGYGEGARGLHEYEFNLDFFDEINAEESAYRILDRHIEFNLVKSYKKTWWDRLTQQKKKPTWLRIDFDRWKTDEESETEDELEPFKEEQMKEMEKKILETQEKAFADIKAVYLFLYNMIQFCGFAYIFAYLLIRYATHGKDDMKEAFQSVIYFVGICQILASLEVVNAATGLVKSGLVATIVQFMGRNVVLFLVIIPAETMHEEPLVCYLFLVWSSVEIIRYPFYAFSCIDVEFETITWLRYTVWIGLYPLGFLSEMIVILLAIPYYKNTNKYSWTLPNNANIGFYYPYYLYFHIVLILFAGYSLMRMMWGARKKKLRKISFGSTKEKIN